jgi:hypothetical protein
MSTISEEVNKAHQNTALIDNRRVLPFGCAMTELKNKGPAILLYTADEYNMECSYVPAALSDPENHDYVGIPESIVHGNLIVKPSYHLYPQDRLDLAAANKKAHEKVAKYNTMGAFKKVILLGPASIPEEEIELIRSLQDEYLVLTVNAALIHQFPYHMMVDRRCGLVTENMDVDSIDFSKITYITGPHADPDPLKYSWKDINWLTTDPEDNPCNLPVIYPTIGVVNSAIQFIFNKLRADKLIILGIKHTQVQYFHINLVTEALCYWFSKHGKEIWNCTYGNLLAGCIISNLNKAISEGL